MKVINVLVTAPVGDDCLKQIAAVDGKLQVTDAADLANGERKGDVSSRNQFDALLAKAEVIFGFRPPRDITTRAPRLKWLQVMSAGVDSILDQDMIRSSITITNVSGVNSIPVSEFALHFMLMFAKQASQCFQLKQRGQWGRLSPTLLQGKTAGIIGLGAIGKEVARMAKTFGMRVMATRKSARRTGSARHVDIVLPVDELSKLLGESDFVVLTLPLTSQTRNFIGEKELKMMRRSAYLINVARGGIVDEPALIRALEENRIAGAGLDVFATEPLPAESKLWQLPNVIISPHIAGGMEDYNQRATDLFCDNLKRYVNGQRLRNKHLKTRAFRLAYADRSAFNPPLASARSACPAFKSPRVLAVRMAARAEVPTQWA